MRVVSKRRKHFINLAVTILGLMCLLVLPLPPGGATGGSQNPSASDPARARDAALRKLASELEAGSSFAEEEILILRRFIAGAQITELEADTLISRALHDFYITGSELTRWQEELLGRYAEMVARRDKDVADLKTRLLDRRKDTSAATAAVPRPLVAPANDLCAGAEVIPAAGPFPHLTSITADITDASTAGDPPVPSCQTNVSRSIWYRFTPSTSATYTISTCAIDGTATTVDDSVMAIYTSSTGTCGGPFIEIPTTETTDGCGDDECVDEGLQAVIRTQLTSGVTYFIVIWEFDATPPTAGNTAVQLKVSQALPPANDACAGATALTLNTPVIGTTEFANDDYQLSGSLCFTGVGNVPSASAGREVVYSFTAPFTDAYSFRVTGYVNSSLSNLVVYTASSCPAAGGSPVTVATCLSASNRGVETTAEEIFCLPLLSGQQIHIFVDENSFTDGSPFTIEATRCASEGGPNDTPGTASALRFGIEGSINPGADVDFFSVGTPASGSRIFALVEGVASNSTDFDLRVTTGTDTLEYDDSNSDSRFGFASPSVAGTTLSGTPAFLRVNQFAATAAEPYRLYAVVQPPISSATLESEPNDASGAADSAANNYFTGSLSGPAPSIDTDMFSFFASAGDQIFLSLDADPLRNNTPINAALALLDAGGTELLSVNDSGTVSSSASGAGSLTSVTPSSPSEALLFRATTTGTYYARVTIGTSSTSAAGAGDYLLSITRNGVTGSCTYSISPPSQPFPSSGGTGTTAVTTDPGCSWTAVSNDSWINITSGSGGTGSGNVAFSVGVNPGGARTGTVTIGGQTFTVTQGTPLYQGFLDAAGCGIITGWAWDANQPNSVISVDIYDGTTLITTIPANLFREDIVNAGIGNGFHGFSFTVPQSLKDGLLHNIRARFAGTGIELSNSPRQITCSGATPSYLGFHDGAGCGTIAGWAWDISDPNNPINVDIYDGATLIATVPAIQFRPDLVTAGIGNGFHGFSFTVPASLKDGQPHSIRVKFPGTTTDLGNTPRTIACSGVAPVLQGFHDQANCNVISGWAWDSNDPNSPINVAIFSDGQLIATVLAIQFRQDLVNAGIGNGYHAFSFNVPASLKNGQPHSIRVRYSGTTASLINTPRTITCSPP